MIDDDNGHHASALSVKGGDDAMNIDELVKDYKKNRRHGMLGWFKVRVSSLIPLCTWALPIFISIKFVTYKQRVP